VAVVEADEGPVRGQLICLEGTPRMIADGERYPMLAQERVHLWDKPARVAELEAVAPWG
jgi:hypothetical protein